LQHLVRRLHMVLVMRDLEGLPPVWTALLG
jgi:hypothetical protein